MQNSEFSKCYSQRWFRSSSWHVRKNTLKALTLSVSGSTAQDLKRSRSPWRLDPRPKPPCTACSRSGSVALGISHSNFTKLAPSSDMKLKILNLSSEFVKFLGMKHILHMQLKKMHSKWWKIIGPSVTTCSRTNYASSDKNLSEFLGISSQELNIAKYLMLLCHAEKSFKLQVFITSDKSLQKVMKQEPVDLISHSSMKTILNNMLSKRVVVFQRELSHA